MTTVWFHGHVEVVRVIDADTLEVDIDHGFGVWSRGLRVRIRDYDAPEHRSHAGHVAVEAERQHAREATEYAKALLDGSDLTLTTYKGNSFNRWIGDLTVGRTTVVDYADHMKQAGYAKRESYA